MKMLPTFDAREFRIKPPTFGRRTRTMAAVLGTLAALPWALGQTGASAYQPQMLPANIAPTPATSGGGVVEVIGQPRMTKGHPCTLWDQEDIDGLKAQIATNPALRDNLDKLTADLDKKIREDLAPLAQGGEAPTKEAHRMHAANSSAMADLGIAYVMTGKEEYAEYAKKLLLEYAKAYKNMPHGEGWTEKKYRSAQDGRLTGQFLEDGFWLARAAFGADLIYNLKSWTPEERAQVKDFLEDVASEFYHPVIGDSNYISGTHNRAAICTSAALMAGYATDNEKLANIALYGVNGTKEKPTGGVLGTHFTAKCLKPDGLWIEGSPAYQMGIASCGLFNDAETLWHHGIDLYRLDNGILKRLLDSAIALAYPTEKLDIPALHDSSAFAVLSEANWLSNETGVPYMCGYRRYQDPAYLPIIKNAFNQLSMTIHAGPPSLFLAVPENAGAPKRSGDSANYFAVGYGVLRIPAAENWNQVLMEYGASGSHGHPSKLALDIFAMNDVFSPFPGVIFPYNDPMDPKWYWTTLGNCALTVDEKSQIYMATLYKYGKGVPVPEAKQMVFAPAATMGMQRAWSDTLYVEKIPQDRAVFLTLHYMADLYAAASDKERKYDLAWHFRGKLEVDLKLSAFTFPEPVADGYNALGNVQKAEATDKSWSATIISPGKKVAKLFCAGGTPTEVFVGEGHYRVSRQDEFPPAMIERRVGQKTALFANAIDFSGTGDSFVKAVQQEGGVDAGYGALKVQTAAGSDVCFVSYRPGNYKAAEIETDAVQAFVRKEGAAVCALYLAGGQSLKAGDASIQRSEPGLAYVEKDAEGNYIVGNPSATDATLSVTLPALDGFSAFELTGDGKRGPSVPATVSGGRVSLPLKAGKKVLFAHS